MSTFNGRYQTKPRAGDTTSRDKTILDVRKGDEVVILRGDEQGKKGTVLRTIPHKRLVVVQNLNYAWKHLRRSQQNPQGGRIKKEAPLAISKVMVVCQSCGQPSRTYRKRKDDAGSKVEHGARFCKKCDKPVSSAK